MLIGIIRKQAVIPVVSLKRSHLAKNKLNVLYTPYNLCRQNKLLIKLFPVMEPSLKASQKFH